MPESRDVDAVGIVRFLGVANKLRTAAPSGTRYEFRKGETTVVEFSDWEWLMSCRDDMMRFEVVSEAVAPEPEPEKI